jgi:hypothetical protein
MRQVAKSTAVGAVVVISLWASIGSADPNSAESSAPDPAESSSETDTQSDQAESTAAPTTAAPIVEKEWIGLDYELLSDNAEGMTELQFEEWSKEFLGTEIGWHGKVERVDESLFEEEGYQVVVDVRGGDGVLERAHLLVDKELALAIPKDAEIYFTGSVKELSTLISLTVTVDGVQIESRDGTIFEPVQATDTTVDETASSDGQLDYELLSTNSQEMTEAQFNDWSSQFVDTEITWSGQVESVDESLFDEGFEIVVDVEGGSGILERAYLLVTKEEALAVPKDADLTFTGTVKEVNNLFALQIKFKDVTFSIN